MEFTATPKEMLADIRQFGERQMRRSGSVSPMFVIHKQDGDRVPISVQWGSDVEKQVACATVRMLIRQERAIGYAFVAEAWMFIPDAGFDLRMRPSQMPGRVEVLSMLAVTHREKLFELRRIVRRKSGAFRRLDPVDVPMGVDAVEGRMTALMD